MGVMKTLLITILFAQAAALLPSAVANELSQLLCNVKNSSFSAAALALLKDPAAVRLSQASLDFWPSLPPATQKLAQLIVVNQKRATELKAQSKLAERAGNFDTALTLLVEAEALNFERENAVPQLDELVKTAIQATPAMRGFAEIDRDSAKAWLRVCVKAAPLPGAKAVADDLKFCAAMNLRSRRTLFEVVAATRNGPDEIIALSPPSQRFSWPDRAPYVKRRSDIVGETLGEHSAARSCNQ